MGIRAKAKSSASRRRTVAVSIKHGRPQRPSAVCSAKLRKLRPFADSKESVNSGVSTYAKALRFLHSLSDYEHLRIVRYNAQNFDLDRMRTLLRKLNNPQDKFRSVHVAGTKGKGSTCAMIASMLQANG